VKLNLDWIFWMTGGIKMAKENEIHEICGFDQKISFQFSQDHKILKTQHPQACLERWEI